MSRNIQQCYRFIFDHYESGDEIFLFGFSRGAATVRSLSSFIHYFGILPKSRPELIKKAYKIYKISKKEKRKLKASEFVGRHHTMWAEIKFLGCYDTVAALGVPFKSLSAMIDWIPGLKHSFHNYKLSESVSHAYHALAIDDKRKTFHPVMWDVECLENQSVRQVWFAGMHTDVGGGYKDQALAGIPLVWMTDMAVKHGMLVYKKYREIVSKRNMIKENENGEMHNSRSGLWGWLYRCEPRSWKEDRVDKPVIHQSVLQRTRNQQNEEQPVYQPWIIKQNYDVEAWVKYEDQNW